MILLSMSNVTLQSIAMGIVANNIATTMILTCYLMDHSTIKWKKSASKGPETEKKFGLGRDWTHHWAG